MTLARYRIHQASADIIRRVLRYGSDEEFTDEDKAGELVPEGDIAEITLRMKKKSSDTGDASLELKKTASQVRLVEGTESTYDFLIGAAIAENSELVQMTYVAEIRVKLADGNREIVVDEFEVEYRKKI